MAKKEKIRTTVDQIYFIDNNSTHCPDCNTSLLTKDSKILTRNISNNIIRYKFAKTLYCVLCKKHFMSYNNARTMIASEKPFEFVFNSSKPSKTHINDNVINHIYVIKSGQRCCPVCKRAFEVKESQIKITNVKDKTTTFAPLSTWYCQTCGKHHLNELVVADFKNKISPFVFSHSNVDQKSRSAPQQNGESQQTSETIDINPGTFARETETYITVYEHSCVCLTCKRSYHNIYMEDYIACVNNIDGNVARIPVTRCSRCGRFYVNKTILAEKEKIYGTLLFERGNQKKSINERNGYYKDDTILSRCGYSAQNDNDRERQAILSFIMNSKKASKSELISIISTFIAQRCYRCPKAANNWKKDLLFLEEYNIDNCPVVHNCIFIRRGTKIR